MEIKNCSTCFFGNHVSKYDNIQCFNDDNDLITISGGRVYCQGKLWHPMTFVSSKDMKYTKNTDPSGNSHITIMRVRTEKDFQTNIFHTLMKLVYFNGNLLSTHCEPYHPTPTDNLIKIDDFIEPDEMRL